MPQTRFTTLAGASGPSESQSYHTLAGASDSQNRRFSTLAGTGSLTSARNVYTAIILLSGESEGRQPFGPKYIHNGRNSVDIRERILLYTALFYASSPTDRSA